MLISGVMFLSSAAQTNELFRNDSIGSINPVFDFMTTPNSGEVSLSQTFADYKQMAPVRDGTKSESTSALAKGLSLNKKGIGFSGYAGYGRGQKLNTKWCSIANAPEFYPYLIADSIGGDYSFERYLLGGAIHAGYLHHKFAIRIDYEGSIHWRSSDPRPKNTVSNISLGAGYIYNTSSGLFGISLSGESRKQHADMRIEEDKRKDRFYQLLGMGLFDHRYSTVESSFSRYYLRTGFQGELSYQQQLHRGWYARLLTGYSKMDVEESDTRISAFNKKLLISSSAGYLFMTSGKHKWDTRLEVSYQNTGGFEQVYKMEQSNAQTGVFIPVLLDRSKRIEIIQPDVAIRSTLHLHGKRLLKRIGGNLSGSAYSETYNPYYRKWTTLEAGTNYCLAVALKKSSIEIEGFHVLRLNLSKALNCPEQNIITREMILPDFRYFTRNALFNELVFSYHHSFKQFNLSPLVKLQGEFASESRKALAITVGLKLKI